MPFWVLLGRWFDEDGGWLTFSSSRSSLKKKMALLRWNSGPLSSSLPTTGMDKGSVTSALRAASTGSEDGGIGEDPTLVPGTSISDGRMASMNGDALSGNDLFAAEIIFFNAL